MPDLISVALADDHALVRSSLHAFIDSQPGMRCAGAAANAEGALRILRAHRVDVLVLDLTMPGIGGLVALPRILAGSPHVKVLVLSGFDFDDQGQAALDAGACAYLQKPVKPELLVNAIRDCVRRPE